MAEKWFGFRQSERVRVHVSDGVQFVEDAADKKSEHMYTYLLDVLLIVSAASSNNTNRSMGIFKLAVNFFLIVLLIEKLKAHLQRELSYTEFSYTV